MAVGHRRFNSYGGRPRIGDTAKEVWPGDLEYQPDNAPVAYPKAACRRGHSGGLSLPAYRGDNVLRDLGNTPEVISFPAPPRLVNSARTPRRKDRRRDRAYL